MSTTVERSKAIRLALKAKGWTSRDVSVVSDLYSMGSSIRVRIKNPAVPLGEVKALATPHESIRWDPFVGEILSGGNRFVDVSYSAEALEAFRAKYLPAVTAALAEVTGSGLARVAGTPFLVGLGRHGHGHGYSLWDDTSHLSEHYDVGGLAEAIGAKMVPAPAAEVTA